MIDPDIRKSSTLPKDYYFDSAEFEASKEYAFANAWHFVGDTDQVKVPGQVSPLELLPGFLCEPLVLTRDAQDQMHCLSNVCTHRGMVVCEGAGNERFLRCRYHGRRFGLDGSFQHMPEFETVENFPTPADNLGKLSLGTWGNLLFANLEERSLVEDWRPLLDRMSFLPLSQFRYCAAEFREFTVRAHWALYVDNYLEGFHIPFIHASLNEAIDYESYSYEIFPFGNLQLAESKDGQSSFDLPKDHPDYGRAISAYYWWIFPNLMLNFYPWGLSINVVRPITAELTKVNFMRYVWKEELLEQGAGSGLDRVEREDEVVVELVQKGLRSRFYSQGRFSPLREVGTHHFHQLLSERSISFAQSR